MGGKGKINFLNILAYAYDNLPNLRFVLTGSEVGLLLDTLRLDDTSSPLYGRYVKIIRLERFDDKKSIESLRKGFEEFNMQFSEEVFYKIYEKVDGIVGWLTYFGYSIAKSRSFNIEVLNEVTEKALKLVQEELDKIFKRSKYYMYVLKAIFLGMNTWFSIKRAVEAWLGRPFQNAQISRLLKTLIELSRVEKRNGNYFISDYFISDPLIAEYFKKI
jgi:AAA+ ATPase superfamily predicted ATPase